MEQPFHSMRSQPTNWFTPGRLVGLAAAIGLQAAFVFALISGLAQTLINKLPEELKVEVQQEKLQPKPPPPPPPQVDVPPPPVAPPPEINIQMDAPSTNTITVSNKPPPPAPPPVVHEAVSTPVSVGRAHTCQQNYPEVSVRLNEEGVTTLSFKVMTDGSVSNVAVAKSSGSDRLDNAAISCAGKWRYKPATQDGNPVEKDWQAAVQWKLH